MQLSTTKADTMQILNLIYSCLIFMAVIPSVRPYKEFTNFTIGSYQYLLSDYTQNRSAVETECANKAAEFALFNTNEEYFAVLKHLMSEKYGFEVWIAVDFQPIMLKLQYWWKDEKTQDSVWHVDYIDAKCNLEYSSLFWHVGIYKACYDCARIVLQETPPSLKSDQCDQWKYFLCRKCAEGYTLNAVQINCTDQDECATGGHQCSDKLLCENTIGSYRCVCASGYVKTTNGECQNIDECMEDTHNCSQTCQDMEGSYNCSCWPGYVNVTNDRSVCEDIDECQKKSDNCEHLCHNYDGSFNCSCKNGFILNMNGFSCEDIDECQEHVDKCEFGCNNTVGSYNCTCQSGFKLSDDSVSCEDIDECQENLDQCQQHCNNTVGSYNCTCKSGFQLSDDGFSCENITNCKDNSTKCQPSCINSNGTNTCEDGDGSSSASNGTSPVGVSVDLCPCRCSLQSIIKGNITFKDILKIQETITKALRVNAEDLSSTRRRKTSAEDERPSSKEIGTIGIIFLVFLLCLVFFCDALSCVFARHR